MTPVLMLGAGRLGGALIEGWGRFGGPAGTDLLILDPAPSDAALFASRMGEHRLHMAAQGLDAGGGHLMTQELDGGGGEHALLRIDDQARLAQPRENFYVLPVTKIFGDSEQLQRHLKKLHW